MEIREEEGLGTYDKVEHKMWRGLENKGVYHFGAMGIKYKVRCMWIDVFHNRGGIAKVL